ncbi:hypothetical protein EDC01DRAFT_744215 [Geopyxis carbonaria]|nr:hypothetical protein EDC01DRAFT_744215 [Geopyxis carbonaria]
MEGKHWAIRSAALEANIFYKRERHPASIPRSISFTSLTTVSQKFSSSKDFQSSLQRFNPNTSPVTMVYIPVASALVAFAVSPLVSGYSLGAAAGFGIHAAASISNSGITTITGNMGIAPAALSSITGFGPGSGTVTGTIYGPATAQSVNAHSAVGTLYNDLFAQVTTNTPATNELSGKTLTAGVYAFATTAKISNGGTLTLNGGGVTTGKWVFKVGSMLSTTVNSKVLLTNGAQACNVFWAVGSSAVIAGSTNMKGNIVASQSISMGSGAMSAGSLFANAASVTLIANSVTSC